MKPFKKTLGYQWAGMNENAHNKQMTRGREMDSDEAAGEANNAQTLASLRAARLLSEH